MENKVPVDKIEDTPESTPEVKEKAMELLQDDNSPDDVISREINIVDGIDIELSEKLLKVKVGPKKLVGTGSAKTDSFKTIHKDKNNHGLGNPKQYTTEY